MESRFSTDNATQLNSKWVIIGQKSRDKTWYVCRCVCGYEKQLHIKNIQNNNARCLKCEHIAIYSKYLGQQHNSWTILSLVDTTGKKLPRKFNCRCECGLEKEILAYDILMNRTCECKDCYNKLNIKDQEFGKLKALSIENLDKNRKCVWRCICKCGNYTFARASDLIRDKVTQCKECDSNDKFKGEGELTASFFNSIRHGAIQRNLEFNIELKEIWNLYLSQNKKCLYTGLDISIKRNKKETTASLDRIDSGFGYNNDNIGWVHKDINRMKQNFSEEKFIYYCKLVADHDLRTKVLSKRDSFLVEDFEWVNWI